MEDNDKKESVPHITITKEPKTKTWLNDRGQTCRRCLWCPGEMILKGA